MARKDWIENELDESSSLREFSRQKNGKCAIIIAWKDSKKKDVMLMLGDSEVEDLSSWNVAERIANKYLNYDGDDTDSWYYAHS